MRFRYIGSAWLAAGAVRRRGHAPRAPHSLLLSAHARAVPLLCQRAAPRAHAAASAIILLQSDVRGAGEAVARMPELRAPAQSAWPVRWRSTPFLLLMIQKALRWPSFDPVWTHLDASYAAGSAIVERLREPVLGPSLGAAGATATALRCGTAFPPLTPQPGPVTVADASSILRLGGRAVTAHVLLTVLRKRSWDAWSEAVKRQSRVRLPTRKSRPVCLVLLTCDKRARGTLARCRPCIQSSQHHVPFKLAAARAGCLPGAACCGWGCVTRQRPT